jgi:hypothetical protein
MTHNAFDGERDTALGAMLAEALTPADSAGFTARLLAGLGTRRNSWDVLASWARPGIAAGLLLASLLGYWLVVAGARGAPAASEVIAVEQPIDGGRVMDVVLGARR